MDNNQLPPGMFTPERPSGSGANGANDTAALLSSPFLLFANALSPITPSRALLAQGVSDAQAAALTALPARSPAPLCFNSPNNQKGGASKAAGDRKRSNLGKTTGSEHPSGLEEVAMSADAAVLAAVNALAQSPLRPGVLDDVQDVASVAALRKQLESEFNVNLTEPESTFARNMSKLEKELLQLDDELGLETGGLRSPGHQTRRAGAHARGAVRGAAARGAPPAGVGAVADMAAAEQGGDANKRSSTTGASMEWPHGLAKTIKADGEDSPRMRSASAGKPSGGGIARTLSAGKNAKKGANGGKNAKKGAAAAALLEEEMRNGRPSSAPAGGHRGGGGGASNRRLSVAAAATPAAKGERAPRMSLDSLRGEGEDGDGGAGCAAKPCNCKKSKCLKLYCECFAAGVFCNACSCQNCQNTPDNANLVATTRKQIELRNPNAFADKIVATDANGEDARHKKGCHCKKSACLKKYCECFQAGVLCQEYCKCEGCKNKEGDSPDYGKGPASSSKTKASGGASKAANAGLATPRRLAAATAAAVAAVEEAAMSFAMPTEEFVGGMNINGDLIIEDLIDIKSPGRSGNAVLDAADGLGLDLLHSPLKASIIAPSPEKRREANAATRSPISAALTRGQSASASATPMKRAEMSPITPGSRGTILRAGPGRMTLNGQAASISSINTRSKAPPPRFDETANPPGSAQKTPAGKPRAAGEEKGAGATNLNEVTPKITRSSARSRGFGSLANSHDALAGGMIATLGSPVPLSTPEGFE